VKTLLIAESRDGALQTSYQELIAFSSKMGAETAMFLVGSKNDLPSFDGTLYLADVDQYGDYNPEVHKNLILETINTAQPDMIVFAHSSYGWDLAPRIAFATKSAQISEVVEISDDGMVVPVCNSKMRRKVKAKTKRTIVTLQAGAFSADNILEASPQVETIETSSTGKITFLNYEEAEQGGVDLSKADVIVSAGRGIGKPENVSIVESLAKALGGELGASRPVVDSEWADHNRQVGTTGQTVSPKVYIACGISGAIQHLAGMKKSEFIIAVNTDKDAPIGEVADVMVIADLKQFLPVLTEKLKAL
jgi:electron transfer flavoprotein alpha subunit